MRVFDLSFRYKVPLWGSLLIIVTTLVVSGSLMFRAYEDARADLVADSSSLIRKLASSLFMPLLEDDIWQAFGIISAPLGDPALPDGLAPKTVIILDKEMTVALSTQPKVFPMKAGLDRITTDPAVLAGRLGNLQNGAILDYQDAKNFFVAAPIVKEGYRLGTVMILHSSDVLTPRFIHIAQRGAFVGMVVLTVLLPINWYWGQHMSHPLLLISKWMNEIDRHPGQKNPDPSLYPHDDELGQLFSAYRRMLQEHEQRAALEQQVIHSERLAAVGRLAAGVAHEINNPLGGMLTAIDTIKSHGDIDAHTSKMVALIERGLFQVKETVSALLVESRIRSRELAPQDFEDIHSLIVPQARKKMVAVNWNMNVAEAMPLQANPVRQLLINLLLNAIQAAKEDGSVTCSIEAATDVLHLSVVNDGKQLSAEQVEHLYEPFSPLSEKGNGLGLWITYQIVQQLGGRIAVDQNEGLTRFSVDLPFQIGVPA